MSELFKAALAGAWTWAITYVFPASLAIGAAAATFGALEDLDSVGALADWGSGYSAVVAIASAILLAMVLAGLNNGLHRMLEGYVLIPRCEKVWNAMIKRQRSIQNRLQERVDASSSSTSLRAALLRESVEDYPEDPDQFGPTRYANSVRALETYAVSRFRLDSQYLWGALTACTPEAARTAEAEARAFVDFLVNLLFLSWGLAIAALAYAVVDGDARWILAVVGFGIASVIWKRLIYGAVRSWRSAVRAVVDLGRVPLAKAMLLSIPASLAKEREMWETVVWALRYRHEESIEKLNEFRWLDAKSGQVDSERPVASGGSASGKAT